MRRMVRGIKGGVTVTEPKSNQSKESGATTNESTEARPQDQEQFLESYLGDLAGTIRNRAKELADQQKRPVRVQDVAQASFEYAPGRRFPEGESATEAKLWQRITSSITGLTIVTAILAVTFGLLGLSDVANASTTQGFLDISK